MIKAIIFDWGWTLHNPQTRELFPGTRDVLAELSTNYKLAIASLSFKDTKAEREAYIRSKGIGDFVESILVAATPDEKDQLLDQTVAHFGLKPEEVAIVDDRVIRGIAWANRFGATSIWIQQGRHSDELPTTITGEPSFTIQSLTELPGLLTRLNEGHILAAEV